MPKDFISLGNKSMVRLLAESGFLEQRAKVRKDEIIEFLRTHPDFIESWEGYSQDKRSSSGWYLLHEDKIWTVGYFSVGGKKKEQRYTSGFEACAVFILYELDQLAESAS
jgi:hypothetical protein